MASMSPEARMRLEWADSARFALEQCHPEQANAICLAWLEKSETGGPRHDPFGMLYSDAKFWAVAAPPHELLAYTLAGLEQLPKTHLTLPMRSRAIKALWRSLPVSERTAFIRHVHGGAA
ncbi:hypothetical protein [Marimonas lutisalis]|uniref:hypothetical protein n=1 Tax=Marimonas lutisalis TaxID=2545756 RepID=UPI0010F9B6F6|nr:hypothetical protein [Marimonas lutisalis]